MSLVSASLWRHGSDGDYDDDDDDDDDDLICYYIH